MLKILLHPTYFPDIITFAHLAQYEVRWEIWDNYQKQTYRNRCYICNDQGKHMLSIPIKHVGGKQGRQRYKEVLLDNSYSWQRQHWRTLETAYRTSPYFEYYEEDLRPLFEKKYRFLLDFNLRTIAVLCASLQLDMPNDKSENYSMKPVDIIDQRPLVNAKKTSNTEFKAYNQVFGDRHGFVSNLSLLDLLFNEGTNALSYLEALDINVKDA